MKKDISFWGMLVVLLLFQLYFFKNNSGISDVPVPFLSGIPEKEGWNGIRAVEYLALLAPVLFLLFCYLDWGDFYISRYGVLHAVRNAGMGVYLWKICLRMAARTLVFVSLQMLLNAMADFRFVSAHIGEMFFRLADYFLIVQCICWLFFFLCVAIGKEAAVISMNVALVAIVLASGLVRSDVFDFLVFPSRIVHGPGLAGGMGWLAAGSMAAWIAGIYSVMLRFVKKKDYI